MQRIGYFSIRGYWRAPLAVFVVIVVGGVAVPGGRELGIGLLGFGAACSAIIAYILSFTAMSQKMRTFSRLFCRQRCSLSACAAARSMI